MQIVDNKVSLYSNGSFRLAATNSKTKSSTDSLFDKKIQVGNDQEKAQSEKDSHSKNRRDRKIQTDCKQSLRI